MLRNPRAVLLALSLSLLLIVGGTPASAMAATRPVVTGVGSGSGPVQPTEVTLRGTSLQQVVAVRFGARSGVVVGASTATTAIVRTPTGMSAGTVFVQVRTRRGGWSKVTFKSLYTFLPAPRITKVSPRTGYYTGGTRVTLTGKGLAAATAVTFGGQPATIISRKASKLVVRTPIGVIGAVPVVVVTTGGASPGTGAATFTYTTPPDEASSEIVPAEDTYVADVVEWVTGGADEVTGAAAPWQVGLPKGTTAPAVGRKFLIKPGNSAYASGLAGTVSEVADQLDETIRVTVAPAPVDTVVSELTADFSGAVAVPESVTARAAGGKAEFPIRGATALDCTDAEGRAVQFGAELTVAVTDIDIDQHVNFGNPIRAATYDVALSAELQTTGKITVSKAASCKLKPAWVNAHRKVVPLGTTGATVSFGPAFEFSISAEGTWSITDRTRTTFAVNARVGSRPVLTSTSRSVQHEERADLTAQVTVIGGVSVQLGLLDRAGAEGRLLLGVTASIEASTAPNICIQADLFGEVRLGLFLDAFVARWESDTLSRRVTLITWRRCLVAETPAPSGEPEITSARLPDATVNQPYSTRLNTADARAGRWTLVRGPLPDGLALSEGGEITGTPTGRIGDYPVVVDFIDNAGKVATTTVRVRVQPGSALGGGDLQATLRWAGAADLDLHVVDPSGEEIYYGRPTSASGGRLDHDANAGCNGAADDDNPVENIYWPTGGAPAGTYTVWVKVYNPCGAPLDWKLSSRRNGVAVLNETGTGDSIAYTITVGSVGLRPSAVRTTTPPVGGNAPKTPTTAGR